MQGLLNRALQSFLCHLYGEAAWHDICREAGVHRAFAESFSAAGGAACHKVVALAAGRLMQDPGALLEDLGAYLVSLEPLRRLLRYGGPGYAEFLSSLEELPDRIALVVPEARVPELRIRDLGEGTFLLDLRDGGGVGHDSGKNAFPVAGSPVAGGEQRAAAPDCRLLLPLMAGILRAMADDYGSIAIVELQLPAEGPEAGGGERICAGPSASRPCLCGQIRIDLRESGFGHGRGFSLAHPADA